MVTDGNYTCGEHSIACRKFASLCCPPDTKVTLYANYTQIRKNWKIIEGDQL